MTETAVNDAPPIDESRLLPIGTDDDDTLRDAVVGILAEVIDEAPEPDEDGEIPVWIDDVLTYATVDAENGVVVLTTYIAESIAGRTRAAEVLGDLQEEWPEFKFLLQKDRVTAEQRVGASPLVPVHLIRAVAALVPLVEETRVLASRLGGEACVFDGEEDDSEDDDTESTDGVIGEDLLAGCGCGDCSCG
ncbi:T3SS (YopN, CesT) and YbjN peptide-binding chaperone 1 [Rhodococcus chondri]|uniref:TY-Chap central domain-containing protein n=1 Tax=Rhodococcus chondri TaxID=3065941 RepID=A0ABU7JU23_9NOCA|nr:hypothetical protein [Rhodococcus sp. CC-R104]MEE2033531.1 hypothetical protein [Rhodococcus sp. CC-R104]